MNNSIKRKWISNGILDSTNIHLFFLLLLFLFVRLLFSSLLQVNEADVIPSAKQFMNKNWLPADWYLNQDIGYRILFNFFVGSMARVFTFPVVSLLGRIIIISLWAFVFTGFIKYLRITIFFIIPLLWLLTEEQSIIAGEWMLRALETKTFAYLTLMAAFLFLYKKRYLSAAFFLGLSVSFHVLVGGYGTLCMVLLIFFEYRDFRIDARTFLIATVLYLIAVSIGLYAIFRTLLYSADVSKLRAGLIYVHSRIPHHVLPSYWFQRGGLWKPQLKLLLCLMVIVPSAIRPWNRLTRLFSRFTLLSLLFAAVGFGLYFIGREDLLKFYPFRLPDTLLPVTAYFLLFSYISRSEVTCGRVVTDRGKRVSGIVASVFLFIIVSVPFGNSVGRLVSDAEYYLSYLPPENAKRELYTWIKNNTPADSVFLISPREEHFYLAAERAQFVSFKHSPQSEGNIMEWYRRLMLLSGKDFNTQDYNLDLDEIVEDYLQLSPERLDRIVQEYNTDYYIGPRRSGLPYQTVYKNGGLAVYDLHTGKK